MKKGTKCITALTILVVMGGMLFAQAKSEQTQKNRSTWSSLPGIL